MEVLQLGLSFSMRVATSSGKVGNYVVATIRGQHCIPPKTPQTNPVSTSNYSFCWFLHAGKTLSKRCWCWFINTLTYERDCKDHRQSDINWKMWSVSFMQGGTKDVRIAEDSVQPLYKERPLVEGFVMASNQFIFPKGKHNRVWP